MKVSEAIKVLEALKGDDHIIFAYWSKEMFPQVSDDEWPDAADLAECEVDWSRAHDDISYVIS